MAKVGLAFQLSANAAGMSAGINAGVVELQKLGYAAKKTSQDVAVLKTLQIGQAIVGGVRAIASAFGQANQLLSGFVNESVAIGEEAQKANVIFGESAAAIQEFARSSSDIGLSSKAALGATASFGNLFTALNLNNQQAAEYSLTLTRLASDLASFNNTTVEDAVLALGAALRGESEPIRRYGVLLSDATLRQVALSNGLNVTSGALSPVVRAQAAYFAILQQTSKAQGDFARTSDGLANQQRILAAEWDNVRAVIGDSLQPAYKAIVQALRESLPAIRQAGQELAAFVAGIDFSSVITSAVAAFKSLGSAFTLLINVAQPLARNILPAIAGALAIINRQAIAAGVAGLARSFTAAATAAGGYSASLGAATVATNVFKASFRGLLAATGVGLLGVAFGFAAEAAINFATRGEGAAVQVGDATKETVAAIKSGQAEFAKFGDAAVNAGAKAKAALEAPRIGFVTLAQDAVGQAASSVAELAKELGGLDRVPADILADFNEIQFLIQDANTDLVNQNQIAGEILTLSQRLTGSLKAQADARKADTDAARKAADEARRINEASRERVRGLAEQGLSPVDQSRLQLARDLVDIDRERANAERDLAQARSSADAKAIADAQERLRLVRDAGVAAQDRARQERLRAAGIDENLLQPPRKLVDQFQAIKAAFRAGDLNRDEVVNALRNLAAEGIEIRREIDRELSRPSGEALRVADLRSSEGIAQFFAAGRRDPAVDQRAQQIAKLDEIRRALEAIGVRPVDILGA